MVELSTSILSVDEKVAIKTFYDIEFAGTNYFHIDVMDGKFVKNDTSEKMMRYATEIKHISNTPLDVHFMVEAVRQYIDDYIPLEPNMITFHIEAVKNNKDALELIKYVKDNGIKVGISVKPKTNVESIYELLPYIHHVLIMSVEPGAGGQKLIPETLDKVRQLKKYRDENELDFDIEIDGGVNDKTIKEVKEAGVDIVVAGSYILHAENLEEAIKNVKKQ